MLPTPDAAAQRPSDPFQSAAPPEAAMPPSTGERPEPRQAERTPPEPSPAATSAVRSGTPPSRPAQQRQLADPSFDLVNHSVRTINEIYVSPSSDRTWGSDLLGRDVLPSGQARRIRRAAGQDCINDIRVVYADGAVDERRQVDTCTLTSVSFGAPPSPQQQQQARGNPSFNLVNNSGRVIEQIYASPSSDTSWGPDRLGQNVLPAGRAFAVRLPEGECLHDIRVVYAGGAADERRRVDTCTLTNVAFGPSPGQQQQARGNPSFTLINNGSQAINAIYVSPSSDTSWGPDRLGQNVLPAGRAFAVRLPDGECLHDIRAVYADGSAQERRRVDTCGLTSLVLP